MVDQQLFTRTLADFARRLVHRYEVSEVLYELAERTAAVVGSLAPASLSSTTTVCSALPPPAPTR